MRFPTSSDPADPATDLDLALMARRLERRMRNQPLVGYLQGKTLIRDRVVEMFGCSALAAEALVDHMQSRGFVRYSDDPSVAGGGRGVWSIVERPPSVS